MNRYKGGKLVEYKVIDEQDFVLPRQVRPMVNRLSRRLSKAVLCGARRSKSVLGGKVYVKGTLKPALPSEHEEQTAFVDYLRKCWPALKFFQVPNGARVRPAVANRLKAEGMSAGVPDLVFPIPRGNYHGLYIEMKRQKGGEVSVDQEIWIHYLKGQGYMAIVCEGCSIAMKVLDDYMGLGPFSRKN